MRVGCYQFDPRPYDIPHNTDIICGVIDTCELDLIIFPELALTGYLFDSKEQLRAYALSSESSYIKRIQHMVDSHDTAAVLGYAERDSLTQKIYNSAICLRPDLEPIIYRKAHLFDTERLVFDTGDTGFFCFDLKGVKLGMLVCFDHYFPEAARSLMLQGTQIICHPSNLVLEGAAQLTTRVRSMENRVFWLLCNRCGSQQGLNFTGGSQITNPNGSIATSAQRDTSSLITADIDPKKALDKSISERNDIIKDRRSDLYTL